MRRFDGTGWTGGQTKAQNVSCVTDIKQLHKVKHSNFYTYIYTFISLEDFSSVPGRELLKGYNRTANTISVIIKNMKTLMLIFYM